MEKVQLLGASSDSILPIQRGSVVEQDTRPGVDSIERKKHWEKNKGNSQNKSN